MLRKFFKFLNVLALLVLLLSCLAAYIEPKSFWQLSFIGFAFPVVLVVNVSFLLLWGFKLDKFALISLVAIALSWKFIHSTFAFNFTEENKESGIKLMSWNVKNFDLYNWSGNAETRKKMMALVKKENPDIICFQEFHNNNQRFKNVQYILDTLGYRYFYFPPGVSLDKPYTANTVLHQEWGVATFSKFSIIDTGKVEFNHSFANDCIYTDISIKGETVRLYNVHFQSIHLGYEDYAALDSLEENQKTDAGSLAHIARKMKRAYTKRSGQANAVATHINGYSGKKIVCGDFNDVPVSYTYNTVKGNLQDAFVERSKGFGDTYVNKLPMFRIDYALFDESIKVNSYRRIRKELSDHYPVIVTFSLSLL